MNWNDIYPINPTTIVVISTAISRLITSHERTRFYSYYVSHLLIFLIYISTFSPVATHGHFTSILRMTTMLS
jgi:hypothetical protein